MRISERLINELQNRLKVGDRRGVHLNALLLRSRCKFDLFKVCRDHFDNKFIITALFIGSLRVKRMPSDKESETVRVGSLDNYVEIQEVLNNE